jgi:hypothetical protein
VGSDDGLYFVFTTAAGAQFTTEVWNLGDFSSSGLSETQKAGIGLAVGAGVGLLAVTGVLQKGLPKINIKSTTILPGLEGDQAWKGGSRTSKAKIASLAAGAAFIIAGSFMAGFGLTGEENQLVTALKEASEQESILRQLRARVEFLTNATYPYKMGNTCEEMTPNLLKTIRSTVFDLNESLDKRARGFLKS